MPLEFINKNIHKNLLLTNLLQIFYKRPYLQVISYDSFNVVTKIIYKEKI